MLFRIRTVNLPTQHLERWHRPTGCQFTLLIVGLPFCNLYLRKVRNKLPFFCSDFHCSLTRETVSLCLYFHPKKTVNTTKSRNPYPCKVNFNCHPTCILVALVNMDEMLRNIAFTKYTEAASRSAAGNSSKPTNCFLICWAPPNLIT